MSIFLREMHRDMKHPDWVADAFKSLETAMRLNRSKAMPECLRATMVVTPIRRMLRGVYGSDWSAVRVLLRGAIEASIERWHGALWRFWRYRVLRKSQEQDIDDLLNDDALGDEGEECCEYCGKPFEDFGDLGCGRCDRRSPEWGLLP